MVMQTVAQRVRRLDSRGLWRAPAAAGAITAVSAALFLDVHFRSLMGDDLYLDYDAHHGGHASSPTASFEPDKYRPALTPLLYALTHLFGGSYAGYRDANLALQIVNVCLVGYLVFRLTRERWLIACGAMAVVAVSRFSAFNVLQGWGAMEGLALAFMLATAIAVERLWRRGDVLSLVVANACVLGAGFTHERYLTLIPFLVVATLVCPTRLGPRWYRLTWTVVPIAGGLLNYAAKVWLVHIPFFSGAGGQPIHLSAGVVAAFMRDGLLTVLGYNRGPDYLSGHDAGTLGLKGIVVAAGLALPVLTIVAATIARDATRLRAEPGRLRRYAVAVSLFVPLLLSASITFRQEYRWLYAPFIIMVVGVSWSLAQLRSHPRIMAVAACLFVLGSLTVDGYYRQYLTNTYFFAAQSRADSVRAQLIDQHRDRLSVTTVVFVGDADSSFRLFDMAGGDLFAVYAPEAAMDVRYLGGTVDAACAATALRPEKLVYRVQRWNVVDVTADALRSCGVLQP